MPSALRGTQQSGVKHRSMRLPLNPPLAGARGDGKNDDAAAINWALQAANDSNAELVFGPKTYAVGATLKKGEGTRVFSHPGGLGWGRRVAGQVGSAAPAVAARL